MSRNFQRQVFRHKSFVTEYARDSPDLHSSLTAHQPAKHPERVVHQLLPQCLDTTPIITLISIYGMEFYFRNSVNVTFYLQKNNDYLTTAVIYSLN